MKTYRMLMVQILSEVTGKDRVEVDRLIDVIDALHPGKRREITISDEQYEMMLAKLRREKSGILNWLIEGSIKA